MRRRSPKMSDPYLRKIHDYWDVITKMYLTFEVRRPIIEFDTVSGQILAYPAKEYLDGLTDRTRDETKKQYRTATADGALMLFVRDESKRVLRSYVSPAAE